MKKYLCGVDYQHEMEYGCADIFDSLEELKKVRPCWKSCGIVEMVLNEAGEEVSHVWLHPQNLRYEETD